VTPSESEKELNVLGNALGQLVGDSIAAEDPILAGGLCVLHSSNQVSLVSVEAQETEDGGTLLTMAVALLSALLTQENDPRVQAHLRTALKATTDAQIVRVTPIDPSRVN
jgi:hypothetical protein